MQPTQTLETPNDIYFSEAVDIEHGGIRMAGCATLLVGFGLSFFILQAFILPDGFIINAFLSVAIAAGLTYAIDAYLTGRWPSGRRVEITTSQVAITHQGNVQRTIDPNQHVNVLLWRFTVRRSQRVKKGWYVVACSLEQDGEYLPVYTFMSPEDFKDFPLNERFTQLAIKRPSESMGIAPKPGSGGSVRDLKIAGEQRRLQLAERDRGDLGAEMTSAQFAEYLTFLQANFERWMPQN